jgi:hypothetical protein
MTPNNPEILRDRGRSLEDEFFRREDKRLLDRLKELKATEDNREALAKASGITKPAVLDKLMQLGVRAETLAALAVVPWSRWHGPMARSMPRSAELSSNALPSPLTRRREPCSKPGSIDGLIPSSSSPGRSWCRPWRSNWVLTKRLASRRSCWNERAPWPPRQAVCSVLARRFRLPRRRCSPSWRPRFARARKDSDAGAPPQAGPRRIPLSALGPFQTIGGSVKCDG